MNNVLHYVELIGKIVATGISLYAIIWSLLTVVNKFKQNMEIAIENRDWEAMITVINEFVTAVEEKYLDQEGAGALKKAEVIKLLEEAGYEITNIIDALIESSVYKQFNYDKDKKELTPEEKQPIIK